MRPGLGLLNLYPLIMKYLLSTIVALGLCAQLNAFVTPFGTASYLGLGVGFGRSGCTGISITDPSLNGEYFVKGKYFAMDAQLNKLYGSDEQGFKFGWYGSLVLGGFSSKWYIIQNEKSDRTQYWQSGFDVMGGFGLGLQAAYSIPDKDAVIGLRYYNYYSVDGLRGSFDNADDGACIGLFAGNNKFGVDVTYVSGKIPGVLVNSSAWNYVMTGIRYNITTWDDDTMVFYGGLHHEYSMSVGESFLSLDNEEGGYVNTLLFTVGIGINKQKK